MSTTGAASVAGALGTALSSLSPLQLFQLFGITQARQRAKSRAMAILASINSPAMAAALVGSLSAIPNLPPEVMTRVIAVLFQNPANFGTAIANATAALQRAVTAPGLLGGLGL